VFRLGSHDFVLGKFVKVDTPREKVEHFSDYKFVPEGHILVVGGSGSGKTILVKDLIEEAIINGYPSIVVDPKGDLGQLSWPYLAQSRFADEKELSKYPMHYKLFGSSMRAKEYAQKVTVGLFDHNYVPSLEALKRAFSLNSSKNAPLSIISLHLADSDEAKKNAFLKLLEGIEKLVQTKDIDDTTNRFLFIDEAHWFSAKNSPLINEKLMLLIREKCRLIGLKICLSTQSGADFGEDLFKDFGFRHKFSHSPQKNEKAKYRWKVKYFDLEDLVIEKDPKHSERNCLLPRWPYSINKKDPLTQDDFAATVRIWEVKNHTPNPNLFVHQLELDPITTLDAIDLKILSCINDIPITHEWIVSDQNHDPDLNSVEYKLTVESLNSNKELKNYHYHFWIDYQKLGFPISAYFVAKGKGNWQNVIQDTIECPQIIEFYEIKPPHESIDVNILCKMRFRNMNSYNDFVCERLLKVSKRGNTRENLCRQIIEDYKQGSKDNPSYKPETPPEQLVSGCICARTFSDHPTCYIKENTLDFLNSKQRRVLKGLLEVETDFTSLESRKGIILKMNEYAQSILNLLKNEGLAFSDFLARIKKINEAGIIKGVYFEIPWETFEGYETSFILGQIDFEEDIIKHAKTVAGNYHQVQEVHTIAGTYDIIIKLRGREGLTRLEEQLGLKDTLLLEVVKAWKVGYRFRGQESI
jgi:DNA-binding Lrp family transcriptional regulator